MPGFMAKIALAQTNPLVGDVEGNVAAMIARISEARQAGAALIVFPEQAILGYPAKDLLLRREIIDRNVAGLREIANAAKGIAALVGYAAPNEQPVGRPIFNAAALVRNGEILGVVRKRLLPTYDVFDEARYFEPGGKQDVLTLDGLRLGVNICEDLLFESFHGRPLYDADPVADLARLRPDILINISASPFVLGKHAWRSRLITERAQRHACPFVYVNQVGGNDELLFDGCSLIADATGAVAGQAPAFAADMMVVDTDDLAGAPLAVLPEGVASLRLALATGLRDYARKCGFSTAVIGLSGGIDSAVVAALAAEALGGENVRGVALPSRFSSDHSIADAAALAMNLGLRFEQIDIEPMHAAFEAQLAASFAGRATDVTEENIQARTRGVILMALSNKFGSLLLTTGNKSEVALGYCTLYGDMAGGLAVISDVPKTMVYQLARHMNEQAGRALIPERTLTKAPSAELRPNQTDQQTLPPYEVVDAVLEMYEERLMSRDHIIAAGYDAAIVDDITRRIRLNEYKRQQAAPGLKVTTRAFGFGRRLPIAARW